MKRFGIKKMLSHCTSSIESGMNHNKSKCKKPAADCNSDYTEAPSDKREMRPRVSEELPTHSRAPINPIVRTQFVLGKVNGSSVSSRMTLNPLVRHLGGNSCELCPLCGQYEIPIDLPPDGQNWICGRCNDKILTALGDCQSQPNSDSINISYEPTPFKIIVLHDSESRLLIDQLTSALELTCLQRNGQPINHTNNSYDCNHNDYINDLRASESSSGQPANHTNNTYDSNHDDSSDFHGYRAPRNSTNSAGSITTNQQAMNPNSPTTVGQVQYDHTQNRIYNYGEEQYSCPGQNGQTGHGYNDDSIQQNKRPGNSVWEGYETNYYPIPAGQRQTPRDCNENTMQPINDYPERQTVVNDQRFKCEPTVSSSSNCGHCWKCQESNDKLLLLITQALELFLNNRQMDSFTEKHKKSKKSCNANNSTATFTSGKAWKNASDTRASSLRVPAQYKEKAMGKSMAQATEWPKGKPRSETYQANKQKFFLPDVSTGSGHSMSKNSQGACGKSNLNDCLNRNPANRCTQPVNNGARCPCSNKCAQSRQSAAAANDNNNNNNNDSRAVASSKSPASGCPCFRQLGRMGGGDSTPRSQANRLGASSCNKGCNTVAHFKPGTQQLPFKYRLLSNGEFVRRSLVRTAAGATLHENVLSKDAMHNPHTSTHCFGCTSSFQFGQ
ncbi:putative uncharacterized protein DDB_G0282133 [Drosophila grimshawi]|uniref:putative uncharacterized protein DDB_G0282133 n=1 Tax=Drosophila grimshawi TaxID=7222 RepID=UPI000C8702FE|nr:putative uncharacterized protein DDB_G0282133 [Drosophila grimshawi]